MNSNSIPATDVVTEASVRIDGNGRACARATVFATVNDVAVRSGGKTRLEGRAPALIGVVDNHESSVSSSESDTLGRGRDPVGDICSLNSIPETNHSGDGGPAVLAVPPISSAIAGTSTVVSVGSTRIPVTELVAGKNCGRTEGMSQDPHMSKRVHVVGGASCQSLSITFGVMIGKIGRAHV